MCNNVDKQYHLYNACQEVCPIDFLVLFLVSSFTNLLSLFIYLVVNFYYKQLKLKMEIQDLHSKVHIQFQSEQQVSLNTHKKYKSPFLPLHTKIPYLPSIPNILLLIIIICMQETNIISNNQLQIPDYCLKFCDEDCIEHSLTNQFTCSMIFTIITLLISTHQIRMHLQNFNNPFFQSKIIVILIMAPFYCITSMGSFIWPKMQPYFTLTRDFYQAILLFTFFYLIFSYLAYNRQQDKMDDKTVYHIMIEYQKQVHHFFPFNLCQKPYQLTHWRKAKYFTYRCKKYVLQFLIVKVVTTILMYFVFPKVEEAHLGTVDDDGGDSEMGLDEEQVYSYYDLVTSIVTWITAISASYSLYYLVLFYHALNKPLAPYSPLLKFLTIKITLFFTFWQRIMITIFQQNFLSCFDQEAQNYNAKEIVSSLQNTLICFEMLVMAFAGGLAYSYENYVSQVRSYKGSMRSVLKDTIKTFKADSRLIKPKKFGFDAKNTDQFQLQTINHKSRPSAAAQSFIKEKIEAIIIQDYFGYLEPLKQKAVQKEKQKQQEEKGQEQVKDGKQKQKQKQKQDEDEESQLKLELKLKPEQHF